MMLHTKYQGLVVSYKIFFTLSGYKTCNPLGRANNWPQGHNLNKLGRGPLDDATYQISRV